MNKKRLRQTACPLIAAIIWGTAFVAQSVSTDLIGAFTFNALRSFIGALALLPVIFIIRRVSPQKQKTQQEKKQYFKMLVLGGLCCGTFLAIASNLQQFGLSDTSPGKAGFITALYIVLVPILGIFFRKKAPASVWISVIVSVAGLYLLCIKDGFSVAPSDIYVLLCAVGFSMQILAIDYFSRFLNGVELSCAQFIVAGILSSVMMLFFEKPSVSSVIECAFPILYVGIFSSGIAYTLQIIAQKDANPTVISLLLSLESVFAAISGAVFLKETMEPREYIGCVLMFGAVVLAQLPDKKHKESKI